MAAETSLAAFRSIETELTELEQKVLDVIRYHGSDGCISDQVRGSFPELSYSSVTARFASLELKGAICRNGDTRAGISGRQQQVMRDARYATPLEKKEKEKVARTGFNAGVIYLSKRIKEAASMEEVNVILKEELLKVWRKEKS